MSEHITKILLVDDRPENLQALQALITSPHLEIVSAKSGVEALSLLLDHKFAVALIDVQMPGISGFELAKLIRGRRDLRGMPIIFVTAGQHNKQEIFEGYETGAVDFLHKPLDPHVVRSKINVFVELDISRKALNQKLAEFAKLKEEAEKANHIKTRFLANVSHEIRTPLSAIIGMAELANSDQIEENERRQYLYSIIENGQHLQDLINDILDLSKIESGNLRIEKMHTPISKILGEVESLFLERAKAKGIRIQFFKSKRTPTLITTDPIRLKQILVNIVGNAVKFTEKGFVEVRIDLRKREREGTGARLEITVRDSGCGIPEDMIENIFLPFQQVDSSNTRNYGGTGLGLSISRSLCRCLGGDLQAGNLNAPQKGAEFRIYIDPRPYVLNRDLEAKSNTSVYNCEAECKEFNVLDSSPEPSVKTQKTLTSKKILVVEDSKHIRRYVERALQLDGAMVDAVSDGLQGIEKCQANQYDLIFVDIQMPGMDGYETVRRMRNINIRCPILAFTAHAMKEERERCLREGFDGHVGKPVEYDRLLNIVRSYTKEQVQVEPF